MDVTRRRLPTLAVELVASTYVFPKRHRHIKAHTADRRRRGRWHGRGRGVRGGMWKTGRPYAVVVGEIRSQTRCRVVGVAHRMVKSRADGIVCKHGAGTRLRLHDESYGFWVVGVTPRANRNCHAFAVLPFKKMIRCCVHISAARHTTITPATLSAIPHKPTNPPPSEKSNDPDTNAVMLLPADHNTMMVRSAKYRMQTGYRQKDTPSSTYPAPNNNGLSLRSAYLRTIIPALEQRMVVPSMPYGAYALDATVVSAESKPIVRESPLNSMARTSFPGHKKSIHMCVRTSKGHFAAMRVM